MPSSWKIGIELGIFNPFYRSPRWTEVATGRHFGRVERCAERRTRRFERLRWAKRDVLLGFTVNLRHTPDLSHDLSAAASAEEEALAKQACATLGPRLSCYRTFGAQDHQFPLRFPPAPSRGIVSTPNPQSAFPISLLPKSSFFILPFFAYLCARPIRYSPIRNPHFVTS